MHSFKRFCFLLALQSLAVFAWAADEGHRGIEHHIKAAFIYKFAAYIEWPPHSFADSKAHFVIGVIGGEEVATELVKLSYDADIAARPIHVVPVDDGINLDDIHVLFVGRNRINDASELLRATVSKPVLVVRESPGALAAGSIINFMLVSDYIRFEISSTNAEINNLKISARLLDVAQSIESGSP